MSLECKDSLWAVTLECKDSYELSLLSAETTQVAAKFNRVETRTDHCQGTAIFVSLWLIHALPWCNHHSQLGVKNQTADLVILFCHAGVWRRVMVLLRQKRRSLFWPRCLKWIHSSRRVCVIDVIKVITDDEGWQMFNEVWVSRVQVLWLYFILAAW